MTGIKKDLLGNLPQELNAANEQMRAFIGTVQSFLGAIGSATSQIGSAVGRMGDQGVPSQPNFLTPQGQNAHSDFMDTLSSRLATDAYTRSVSRRGEGQMISAIGGGGKIAFNDPIADIGGTKIHTVFPDNANNRAVNDLQNQIKNALSGANSGDQAKLGARYGLAFPSERPGTISQASASAAFSQATRQTTPITSHLGYTMADLPRVSAMNSSEMAGGIGKTIESLRQSDDVNSKATVRVLENIQRELSNQAREFGKARDAFVMAGDIQDKDLQVEAQNKLIESLAKLDQTMQSATTAQKGIPQPGGTPPSGPGLFSRLSSPTGMLSLASAGIGLGLAGYQFYNQSANTQDRAIMDGRLSNLQGQAGLAKFSFGKVMESQDMTNSENILRYRGNNFLSPHLQGKYFGDAAALGRSYGAGGERGQIGIDIDKRERQMGIVSGVGNIALQGLGGIGGALLGRIGGAAIGSALGPAGALVGGILGYQAVSSLMRGGEGVSLGGGAGLASGINQSTGIAGNYMANSYNAYSGDLTDGALQGAFGGFRRGGQFQELGDGAVQGARLNKILESRNFGRSIQDAEMESRPEYLKAKMAIDQRLSLVQARKEGAILVGQYATGGEGYLRSGLDLRSSRLSASSYEASRSGPFAPSDTDYNYDRLAKAVRLVETGSSSGDYDAVNKYGMVGAYQMAPGIWNRRAIMEYGSSIPQMRGKKDLQDKFYSEQIAPEMKQQAIALQKRNYAASLLPTELVAGWAQLGGKNIETFLNTGSLAKGNDVNDPLKYLAKLSMATGKTIPMEFMAALQQQQGSGAGMMGPSATNAVTATGLAANLEMSMSEFAGSQNQLTNYLGNGRRGLGGGLVAGAGQTAEMIRLGRSGLGSFDQLLGNLGSINSAAGGQDNTRALEATLSQAVAAGFDKSRTAQRFVQSSTQIAESLRLTNMANTSAILGTTSTLLSGSTGIADERSLGLAAAGIQAYGSFTGQTGGLSGALTAIGVANAGFTARTGANIVSKLSAPQMSDFIKNLDGSGPINDVGLNSLLEVSGMSRSELQGALRGVRRTTLAPFTTSLDQYATGQSFGGIKFKNTNDFLGQIQNLPRKAAETAITAFRSAAYNAGEASPVGGSGMLAYLGDELESRNMGQYKNLVDGKKASGNQIFRDAANQNRLNFIEDLTKDFTAQSSGGAVGIQKAKDFYFRSLDQNLGATQTISVNGREVPLDRKNYESGDGAYKKAADDAFKKMDVFEISRGLQDKALQESNAQPVRIMNLNDMIETMYRFGRLDDQGRKSLPGKE